MAKPPRRSTRLAAWVGIGLDVRDDTDKRDRLTVASRLEVHHDSRRGVQARCINCMNVRSLPSSGAPMSGDNKEPNAILNALSNTIAAIRADDDMLELAKAHEGLPVSYTHLTLPTKA